MKVIGVDLAAKEDNPTGIAIIGREESAKLVYTDKEILDIVELEKPEVVAIDAPLHHHVKSWRSAERALMKKGFHPLPLTIRSMKELTDRAIALKKKISCKVIEVFPSATRAILVPTMPKHLNKDEQDALLAARTAKMYLENKTESLGANRSGRIIIPKATRT
jgi:predicted nuclease with RNAse H fold